MKNFDNFYGSSDFSGTSQTLVKNQDVVCHSEQIEIVQQQLAVIREWYKKIITEQICEVEVQSIVHQQFVSGCEGFSSDIRRASSNDRSVSFDHNIASQITVIHDSNNECVTNDLGWQGTSVGSNAISYSGDNWNSQYSPPSVSTVYGYCQQSYGYSVSNGIVRTYRASNALNFPVAVLCFLVVIQLHPPVVRLFWIRLFVRFL
ncbi:hypothetical protein K439DRAFT_1354957 [Ramaria rubella]|nr:hypothetical protein K439DRAFT_1354957 [Ramaria rubella]